MTPPIEPRDLLPIDERVQLIDRTRAEISTTIGEIRVGVTDATDWRSWVKRYPLASVAVVAAAGAIAAGALGAARGPRRPAAGPGRLAGLAARAGIGGLVLPTILRRIGPALVDRLLEAALGALVGKDEPKAND